jgi:hypothetical protein
VKVEAHNMIAMVLSELYYPEICRINASGEHNAWHRPENLHSRVFQNSVVAISAVVRDPLEAWIKFTDYVYEDFERHRTAYGYEVDSDWERQLHVSWPCPASSEFLALWPEVLEPLSAMI